MRSSIFEVVDEKRAALFASQQRTWRRMLSIPRVLESARKTRVGESPTELVLEDGPRKLLRYRRTTPAIYAEPVLFCYALINRPYILDLQPDKSVVQQYLRQGFEVYIIDWGVPSVADRELTLEDYVCGFLQDSVAWILGERASDKLHLIGYCMGGTMAAMFAAIHPRLLTTLTLLAAPIDFGGRESLLNVWADPKYFDVDAFVDANGNCPAGLLQLCFLFTKPVQNLIEKYITLYDQLEDPLFLANYFAVERWVNDNIPVAGETFREFVKKLYQRNQLVRGEFRLGARKVELGQISCPLLLLTAKNDHLVAPPMTEGIRPHVASRDVRAMSIDAGHVGLAVSSKAHKTFWPEATRWLAERSAPVRAGSLATVAPFETQPLSAGLE